MSQIVTQNSTLSQNWVGCTRCTPWPSLRAQVVRTPRAGPCRGTHWRRVVAVPRPCQSLWPVVSQACRCADTALSQLPSVMIQVCIATSYLPRAMSCRVACLPGRVAAPTRPCRGLYRDITPCRMPLLVMIQNLYHDLASTASCVARTTPYHGVSCAVL